MYVAALELADFRCYESLQLELTPGLTIISGANAQGKTTLLEAVAWTSTARSFRGVPDAALVREGREGAIVRARSVDDSRTQNLEAEIRAAGRNRVRLNGQAVGRARPQGEFLRVTVFAPDDLELVKGGPAERRGYLDVLLEGIAPRFGAVQADYERIVRQRNALLRDRRWDAEARRTLDVFDTQLARAGGELLRGRLELVAALAPLVAAAYADLAGHDAPITATYETRGVDEPLTVDDALEDRLREALERHHRVEMDRAITLVGPHRDEWRLEVAGLESRTRASQGEQRTLALALRLGGHRHMGAVSGSPPVLLLDDVFSELDDRRAGALVESIDAPQTLVTSVGTLPPGLHSDRALRVSDGCVVETS